MVEVSHICVKRKLKVFANFVRLSFSNTKLDGSWPKWRKKYGQNYAMSQFNRYCMPFLNLSNVNAIWCNLKFNSAKNVQILQNQCLVVLMLGCMPIVPDCMIVLNLLFSDFPFAVLSTEYTWIYDSYIFRAKTGSHNRFTRLCTIKFV